MNINKVKELAEIINTYGLTALEVSEGETKIRLEQGVQAVNIPAAQAGTQSHAAAQPQAGVQTQQPAVAGESENAAADTAGDGQTVDFNHLTEVKSPLVGVFYSAPSPGMEAFVTIGHKVKKGDVLCIIETMKLMNEIIAEQDGEIVDICVKNGDIVEFGQVLFKLN